MATSDVWELTTHGRLLGQQCDNVFFYQGVALTDPDEQDIAECFYDQVWSEWLVGVNPDFELESIEVRHLFSGASPFIQPVSEVGTAGGGSALGAFEAYAFTLGVESNVTRPGSKRLGGIDEAAVTDGVVSDSGAIATLGDIADAFAANLVDIATGLVVQAVPIVVKRILDGDSYRLPANIGEFVGNFVTTVVPSLLVTSQNSRKVGRGS